MEARSVFCSIFLKSHFHYSSCHSRLRLFKLKRNSAYAHDVMAAILVLQNNETAAVLVYQTNLLGVELFSYENTFS